MISFTQLRLILSSEHDTAAVLKYLQQVAVLVQGNWVVNSELIYIKDSVSSQNGIPAELMCRARDYIVSTIEINYFKKIYTLCIQNVFLKSNLIHIYILSCSSYYHSLNNNSLIGGQYLPLSNYLPRK